MGLNRARKSTSIATLRPKIAPTQIEYSTFDQINGLHSWQKAVPEGSVLYPARQLHYGKIVYFNYDLAKEMGLIKKDHEHALNSQLEKKLLETFNLRIINEYDEKNSIRYHPSVIKKNKYMATRYLQLQHSDKKGRTSGDGRSIWNGEFKNKNFVWDISSRGTGVTSLSPGAVEAGRPLKSGSTHFGYGCGLADIDELLGAAIMAESFHRNGIKTERMLLVIDHGDGNGIGVRAGLNLFRPAHLFIHLKQENWDTLKRAVDYFIDRQYQNKEWLFNSSHKKKYQLFLNQIAQSFGAFAAQLERDYIFAWLDWDGDNVLANAGIIDYGSIRQFGLRHDEYRYDDVDRFSTNLNEQKTKARQIVQVFAQLVDYLESKNKKALATFEKHESLKVYDTHYSNNVLYNFLKQVGVQQSIHASLMQTTSALVKDTYKKYVRLERIKTKRQQKVSDGINRPAILNMRKMLRELSQWALTTTATNGVGPMPAQDFFKLALSSEAKPRDRKLNRVRRRAILQFQKSYLKLIRKAQQISANPHFLKQLAENCASSNPTNRMTGDGLLYVVEQLMKVRRQPSAKRTLQAAIDSLVDDQSQIESTQNRLLTPKTKLVVQRCLRLIDGHKESI